MEKRSPITIVVHLARAMEQATSEVELTYTNNISHHGACVISSTPWKPGELAEVTLFDEQITLRGRVVHCQKRGEDHYAIGLTFQRTPVTWSAYASPVYVSA